MEKRMRKTVILLVIVLTAIEAQNGMNNVRKVTNEVSQILARTNPDAHRFISDSSSQKIDFFVTEQYIRDRYFSQANATEAIPVGDFFSELIEVDAGQTGGRRAEIKIVMNSQLFNAGIDPRTKNTLSIKLLAPIFRGLQIIEKARNQSDYPGEIWDGDSIWYTGLIEVTALAYATKNPTTAAPVLNRRFLAAGGVMAMVAKMLGSEALLMLNFKPAERDKALKLFTERYCRSISVNDFAESHRNAGKIMARCLAPKYLGEALRTDATAESTFMAAIVDHRLGSLAFSLAWHEIMYLKGVESGNKFKNGDLIPCGPAGDRPFGNMTERHNATRSALYERFSETSTIKDGTTALQLASILFLTSAERAKLKRAAQCGASSSPNFISDILRSNSDEALKRFQRNYTIDIASAKLRIREREQTIGEIIVRGLNESEERSGLNDVTDNYLGKQPGDGAGRGGALDLADLFQECKNIERDLGALGRKPFILVNESDRIRLPHGQSSWKSQENLVNINPNTLFGGPRANAGYPDAARQAASDPNSAYVYGQIHVALGAKIKNLYSSCNATQQGALTAGLNNTFRKVLFKKLTGNEAMPLTMTPMQRLHIKYPSGAPKIIHLASVTGEINAGEIDAWRDYKLIGYDTDYAYNTQSAADIDIGTLGESTDIVMYLLSPKREPGEQPLLFFNDMNIAFYFIGSSGDNGGGSGFPDPLINFPDLAGDVNTVGHPLKDGELKSLDESFANVTRQKDRSSPVGAGRLQEHQEIANVIWALPPGRPADIGLVAQQFNIYKATRTNLIDRDRLTYYYFAHKVMPEAAALAFAFYLAGNQDGVKAVLNDIQLLHDLGTPDARKSLSYFGNLSQKYDPYYFSVLFLTHYCGLAKDEVVKSLRKAIYAKKSNGGQYPAYNAPVGTAMQQLFGPEATPIVLVKIATHSARLTKRVIR